MVLTQIGRAENVLKRSQGEGQSLKFYQVNWRQTGDGKGWVDLGE